MAEKGHNMEASVRYKVESDGLVNAAQTIEQQNAKVKELTESYNQLAKAIKSTGNANSSQKQSSSSSKTDDELSKLMRLRQSYQAGLKSHQEYVDGVKKGEEELRKKLASMNEDDKTFDTKLKQYRAYQTEVERIEKANTQVVQREAKAQSSALNKEINSSISSYSKLNQEIQKMAGVTTKGSVGSNILNGMLSYGVINQARNALSEVSSAISEINYNTVNNIRLMGDLGDQTEKTSNILTESAVSMAKTTGIQVTDAQQIQGAWIRINDEYAKSPELLTKISQMTAEFMNVGEIDDAEQAVALLNASLLQLKDSTQDTASAAQEFLDKWAYMADKTAMGTADEYGEAIAKYGAQLKNVGGDMDDAIAQASVLADRLALNGSEIGNALKTFNTYLTRDKTVGLFSDIANMEEDASYRLTDNNGKLKEYRDILDTISRAYKKYNDEGNNVMANSILDAVGATRRRDVATAMLNADLDGSYQSYLDMVKGGETSNYIEDQNAKLMDTLKNQWNSLVASMTGAGMSLANSGILESLTNIIQVAGSAFDAFSKLPTPVLQFITTVAELKLGLEGLKKIGEITGLSNELSASFKSGTKSQREMAAATSDAVVSFEKQQQAVLASNNGLYGTTEAYSDAQYATLSYTNGLEELGKAYTDGKINATQFTNSVQTLTDSYHTQLSVINDNAQAKKKDAETELKVAEAARDSANTEKEKADAIKKCQEATKKKEEADKNANAAATITDKTNKNIVKTNEKVSSSNKEVTVSSKELANSLKEQNIANVQTKAGEDNLSNSNEKFSITNTIASATTGLLSRAVTALGAAFKAIFNPVNIILTAISLLIPYLQESTNESEKLQNQLDSMNDELDTTQSRISELNDLKSNRGLTANEENELRYLKQKNDELEKSIKLTKQAQTNSEYTKHQGGIFGIGGTNSTHEDIQESIREFNRSNLMIQTYQDLINDSQYASYKNTYIDDLNEENKKLAESAANVVSRYYELKDAIDNNEYSGDALEKAKDDLKGLEELLPNAQLLINSVDNTGYSFQSAADKAEEYAEAVKNAADTASKASSKYNSLQSAVDTFKEQGYLTDDQVRSLLDAGSNGEGRSNDFANLIQWDEASQHFVLVADAEQSAVEWQHRLTEETKDYLEQSKEVNTYSAQQEQVLESMSTSMEKTKSMVSDISDIYKNIDGVDKFSDSIKEIQDDFSNGVLTLDDYNSKMKSLTEDTDFSNILASQEEINKMNSGQLEQMYAQQSMWQALYADAGDTLSAITDQFNEGNISQEEYAVALAGVNDRFIELAEKAGIIQETSDGFVDADGNTVEWANSLQSVSDKIGNIGALFADNTNSINQLMNGSKDEAQAACSSLETSFNTTMGNLKSTNEDTWNAVISKMAEVNGMSFEEFCSKFTTDSGTLTSDVTSNTDLMKAGFSELGDQLSNSLESAKTDGAGAMSKLKDDVVDKMSDASTNARKKINSIQSAIDNLKGKDLTINVNYKENGKPAGVNGIGNTITVNKSGGQSRVNGDAFANGSIGSTYSGNTLVGELGNELLVRGNQWQTIGDHGAEFIPIRKGDIVFNHEQTKELLKNGRTTSGSGRGKAYANGNALLHGNALAKGSKYSSSYKITDDVDVANTKAVQKYAREAEAIIAQAVAAGEDISDELREAAQNAEKIAKDVESYTSKYISNVESLQKRAASALEDHYKQEYDDRKKLLEKEHNAKLDAIDEEIARLKGDTTEDKEKQLSDLQNQLNKWKNDNSSLGKKKQKELQEQIDDLDKEIKIDKLEKQRDTENDSYKASIDSDSDTYDAVLKSLDAKMTDENLYKTVNDLIKKNDTDTLTKLLTEHDSQWDGWQTLNGKSASEVIGDEVRTAINNYNDVTRGTINQNGGASSANSGASAATPAPAPAKVASVGSTVNAGSATIYSTSYGGGGGRQYYSSDPVYTIVGENNGYWLVRYHKLSSGYTGWFKKSDVTAMATGGYTGNNEGMAMLHAKERVLSARQTAAFEKLVYNLLPSLPVDSMKGNVNNTNNNGNVFNKELVKVDVGQIINNTPFDVKNTEDNLDRMFRSSLKKSGINLKVK